MPEQQKNSRTGLMTVMLVMGLGIPLVFSLFQGYRAYRLYMGLKTLGGGPWAGFYASGMIEIPIVATSTLWELSNLGICEPSTSPWGGDVTDLTPTPIESGDHQVSPRKRLDSFASFTRRLELESELETRFWPQIASFMPMVTDPASLPYASFAGEEIFIAGMGDTGKLLHALAMHQAAAGKPRQAFRSLLCALYLAHVVEAFPLSLPPSGQAPSLMEKMVSSILRRSAADAMIQIVPIIRFQKAETQALLDWFEEFERRALALHLLEFAHAMAIRNLAHEIRRQSKLHPHLPTPTSLLELYGDSPLLEPYLKVFFEAPAHALQLPFPKARRQLQRCQRDIDLLNGNRHRFGLHWANYLLRPERYFLESNMSGNFLIKMDSLLVADGKASEALRGTFVSIALVSYHNECGTWPPDLDVLATWLGKAIPKDVFTDAPHVYQPGTFPRLVSPGPDELLHTADDFQFLPVWGNPGFSPVVSHVLHLDSGPLLPTTDRR